MTMGDPDHTWKREDGTDKRKCPKHKTWMKKGVCEVCRLEADKRKKEYEKLGGSNKPPVRIIKY